MLIAQISDTHISLPPSAGDNRADDLKRSIDYINALSPLPDLVVHTGDISHDGKPEEYALAAELLSKLEPKLLVMPGNRDKRDVLKAHFGECLGENCHDQFVQYSIGVPGGLLVMVDSVSVETNKGELCDVRFGHLEALLGESDGRDIYIFMHHPPFVITASKFPIQFDDWGMVDRLAAMLQQYPNVRQIIGGHTHRDAEGALAGLPALTVPSIAEDLRMGGACTNGPDRATLQPVRLTTREMAPYVAMFWNKKGCPDRPYRL